MFSLNPVFYCCFFSIGLSSNAMSIRLLCFLCSQIVKTQESINALQKTAVGGCSPKVELASKLSPMPRPDWSIKACKDFELSIRACKDFGSRGFKCSQGSCDWRHWWGSIESYMRTFTQYLHPVDGCAVFSICSIFFCQWKVVVLVVVFSLLCVCSHGK
jgi:hypothetical protein